MFSPRKLHREIFFTDSCEIQDKVSIKKNKRGNNTVDYVSRLQSGSPILYRCRLEVLLIGADERETGRRSEKNKQVVDADYRLWLQQTVDILEDHRIYNVNGDNSAYHVLYVEDFHADQGTGRHDMKEVILSRIK